MFKHTRVIAAISLVTVLGGCANMNDTQVTQAQGAGAGAVLGALIGYAVGDEKGALIGAAIGAGAGYVVGNEIAQRKQQYASTEDFLNGEIQRTAEFNRTARAYNNKTRSEISSLRRESERLQSRYAKGKADRSSLVAKRTELQTKLNQSKQLEATLQKEFDINQTILAEERQKRGEKDWYVQSLDKEVKALQRNIETLRQDSVQLAQIDQRLSV